MSTSLPPQNMSNHGRWVPGFHFLTGALVGFNFVWAIVRLVKNPGLDAASTVLVATILIALFWYVRAFPIAVQDRVIRLEERLRLERLLPPDLKPRILEFTRSQLIALRFAGDSELPELARRVLDEKLSDRKSIKSQIKVWRPDHYRA
ncbi:MAG: DUF6526 family protein [Gemmatimonadota bacterium]|nr:DUF6526 family protein [Gemmatimonadota bacterium]